MCDLPDDENKKTAEVPDEVNSRRSSTPKKKEKSHEV